MTEYDCDKLIGSKVDFLHLALRGSKETVLGMGKSFLGQIADGIKTPAKKWLNSQEYKEGDIVSLNNILYIALTNNINQNPLSMRFAWKIFKLPYTQNQGKVKAFCVFKTDLTILSSYNIAAITEATNSEYTITFTTPIVNPISIFGLPESDLDEKLYMSSYVFTGYTKHAIRAKIVSTNLNQTSLSESVADNNNRYITMIVYSSGDTLQPM